MIGAKIYFYAIDNRNPSSIIQNVRVFPRMMLMSKCFLSIVAFVCVSSILAADRVTMISGSDIEGQVVRDTPGDPLVAINTGGKLTLLNRSDISAITLDATGSCRKEGLRACVSLTGPEHFATLKERVRAFHEDHR